MDCVLSFSQPLHITTTDSRLSEIMVLPGKAVQLISSLLVDCLQLTFISIVLHSLLITASILGTKTVEFFDPTRFHITGHLGNLDIKQRQIIASLLQNHVSSVSAC